MSAPDVDIAIVGGGLAGTLTALALSRSRPGGARKVAIIDQSQTPLAGRHWAYFSPSAVEPSAEVAAWPRVRVRSGDGDVVLPLQRYRYRRINGDLLAAALDDCGARLPRIHERVTGLFPGTDAVRIRLTSGALRARWVLDSVFGLPLLAGGPWLSFLGIRIAVPAAPQDPVLMDFTLQQSDSVRFGYVLPEGPGTLFVEATSFRSEGPDTGLAGVLEEWLIRTWPDHRTVGPVVERASLPLHRRTRRRQHGRIVHIGRAGGRTRRTTGYGVLGYQRDAAAIARALARTGRPGPLPPPPRLQGWLDDVAMRVLARDPVTLWTSYQRLFARLSGDEVLAFLAGEPTPRQAAAVLSSLPLRPFLRAALAG